jgi:hypothetical protein
MRMTTGSCANRYMAFSPIRSNRAPSAESPAARDADSTICWSESESKAFA